MKVGLVGCGFISEEHMKAWRRVKSAHVGAVCDINEERAASAAQRWKVPSFYTDLEKMIRREELQFLSVCSPSGTHAEVVCKALELGVNVIVEKPLAMTTKEAEKIAEAARQSTAKSTMITNLLFNPATTIVCRVLASLHQEPTVVIMDMLKTPDDSLAADPTHWGHRIPGGAFGEVLIHGLYLVRSFLGDLKVRGLYLDKLLEYKWMRWDELTVFLGAPGKQASIHISFNAPHYRSFMNLFGQEYAVRAEFATNEVHLFRSQQNRYFRKGADALRETFAALDNLLHVAHYAARFHLGMFQTAHELNINSFVECVASGKSPIMTIEDACTLTRLQEDITSLVDTASSKESTPQAVSASD